VAEKTFGIRRFELSDIDDVIRLLSTVFKTQFTSEWWMWKYKFNPAGCYVDQGDIWVADSNNGIIGYYAVIPEKMKFGSKTITVAQSVDTATHPDYRGLGIFSMLARKVYSEVRDRYHFLYGFANEMAYKGFLRLGWEDIQINSLFKFLNYDRSLRISFNRDFLVFSGEIALKSISFVKSSISKFSMRKCRGTEVEVMNVDQFPDTMNNFWESVRSEYNTVVERQANFLNWRFSKFFGDYRLYIARSTQGEMVGYMVLKKNEIRGAKSLSVIDLHALPDEDRCVLSLINTAINIAKEEEDDLINCWVPQWHKYAKLLSKLRFISLGWVPQQVMYLGDRAILYTFGQKEIVYRAKKEWLYTLADTDYA
jgi:GNAT superfamily N-acetyltransferase